MVREMGSRIAVALFVFAAFFGATATAIASRAPTRAEEAELVTAGGSKSSKVICFLAERTWGYWTYRPWGCIFHKRGAPNDYADILRTSRLHWNQWGHASAYGEGKAVLNMAGLVPVRVKLTQPVTACGHIVFSHAYFKLPDKFDGRRGWGPGMPLDTRLSRCANGVRSV